MTATDNNLPTGQDEGLEAPRRYMGRPEDPVPTGTEQKAAPEAFSPGSQVWLHIPPSTQTLVHVPSMGSNEGKEITNAQRDIVLKAGWCEAVAYHASFDQYWKMPSHGSILGMPKHYGIPMPPPHLVKVRSQLVKADQPKGFWFLVRIRLAQELEQQE